MCAASVAAATVFGTAVEAVPALDCDSPCLHGALFVLGYAVARWLRRRSGPAVAWATQASACKSRAHATSGAHQCDGATGSAPPSPVESGPAAAPPGSPRVPWTTLRAPLPALASPSCSSSGGPSPPSPSPAPPRLAAAEASAAPTVAGALLAAGLGVLLERRCLRRGGAESTPVAKLPALLLDRAGATETCLPLALAYLDRLQRAGAQRAGRQGGVCARFALVALVLASKFHDDDPPFTNAYYSELGGVPPGEFDFLEREFCRLLDWNFFVAPEEFDRYRDFLYSAALETMS